MRDKIVFFILGALLATLAYFAGDMNNAKAKDEVVIGDLDITGNLTLAGSLKVGGGTIFLTNTDDISQRVTITADDKQAAIILENQVDPNTLPNTVGSKSSLYLSAYTIDEIDVSGAGIVFVEDGEEKWRLSSDKPIR